MSGIPGQETVNVVHLAPGGRLGSEHDASAISFLTAPRGSTTTEPASVEPPAPVVTVELIAPPEPLAVALLVTAPLAAAPPCPPALEEPAIGPHAAAVQRSASAGTHPATLIEAN